MAADGAPSTNPGAAARRPDHPAHGRRGREVAGDQTFAFDDSEAIGTLRCVDARRGHRVLGFTDGDAAADFCIDIVDGGIVAASYAAADFAL